MAEKSFSKLSSDTISALRFPLMVGIVFIHMSMKEVLKMRDIELATDMPQWFIYMTNLFSDVFPRIAVPLFFLMSGYLFFCSGITKGWYKKKLGKRATSLLIPYVLWNIITIIRDMGRSLPFLSSFSPARTEHWSLWNFLMCFWNKENGIFIKKEAAMEVGYIYPEDIPLWYVRDLMIVILLSPLIYYVIKKLGWYFVLFLAIVWYFVAMPNVGNLPQMKVALFFFSCGACFAIKGIDFVAFMRQFNFAPVLYLIIAFIDMLTKGYEYNGYFHNAGIIIGMVALVSVTASLLENGKIHVSKFLANASFFLFALHSMILGAFGKVVVKTIPIGDSPIFFAIVYFVVPIVIIAFCLALYWLLRRFTPRLCALLTGGR